MSDLRVATISDVAGTGPVDLYMQSAAKSWASHNLTPTIVQSLNISSLTDIATGNYQFNVTNSFAALDYAALTSANANVWHSFTRDRQTSDWEVRYGTDSHVDTDSAGTSSAMGDLA